MSFPRMGRSWIQGRPNDEPDPGAPRSAMENHLKGLPTREGKLGRGSIRSAGPVSGLNNEIHDPGVSSRSGAAIGRRLAGQLLLHPELWTRTNSHTCYQFLHHSCARFQAYQNDKYCDPLFPAKVCT
ncbi:hypothetical protein An01g06300 [Aspergillus niger]|uniref:Uncharacterized protein n=2 Tax=Aspergillus niger TaxID=5061 RepID=A2Q915_ASPNC|nr:hypothetical protein An01g06300 [Aspergillus niger]CAK32621.1 hypothetical protein An01g06300 [Aspergillus niger]